MSHLRAPAARADRREGGRHGRPAGRTAPALPETHIRPQLLRLAVLPPIAVALSACAAVLFTVRSTGVRPGLTLWAVLAGAVSVTLVGIVVAAVAADRAARSVHDRIDALRRSTARREADLRALVEALRRGDGAPQRKSRGGPPEDADDFELLAADLARAHDGAVTAVVQASQLSSQAGSEQKLEVFVNLARRLQSLVHREISILDELENEIEDPDLLKGLFHVDHLATRIRRHAENLAVLGGAVSRRQWSNPVSMTEVLRSAIAEVEQYSRVKLVPPIDGTLRGHAVADVIHLLAELVENATVFSAPQTQVLLRANLVTSGLAVEVEDRGLGMPADEQKRMNALLADPDQVNVARLLADGRIGLFVVSQLARRHGITVRLQTNIYGGVQAVLVVPQALLGGTPGTAGGAGQPQGGEAGGADRPAVPPRQQAQGGPGGGTASGAGSSSGGEAVRGSDGASSGLSGPGGASGPGAISGPGTATGPGAISGPGTAPGFSAASGAGTGPGSDAVDGMPAGPGAVSGAGAVAGPGVASRAGAVTGAGAAPASGAGAKAAPRPDGTSSVTSGGATSVTFDGASPAGTAAAPPVVPRQQQRGSAPAAAAAPKGGRPAPLPVRGARKERPNPAEAVPGIRDDDRRILAENVATPPTPRNGAVRGTMGKPGLPRRRAQEHIAPQLRGGPAPRQDSEFLVGHDPGLMAAFQRGIGLAEARQHMESAHMESGPMEPGGSAPTQPSHAELPRRQPIAVEPVHRDPIPMQPAHREPAATEATPPTEPRPMDAARTTEARTAHTPVSPETRGMRDGVPAPRPDHTTTRHDGSAPAG